MTFQRGILDWAPHYMRRVNLGRLLEAVGLTLDGFAERAFLGQTAAIPYAGGAKTASGMLLQCEPEVLPFHARDRQITLYPSEPIPSQRVTLSRWHQLHARRGTHRGELERVQPYFLGADGNGVLPLMRIVHQDGDGEGAVWHTLSGSADAGGAGRYSVHRQVPSNWDFDGLPELWSRWWAIIYTSGTSLATGQTFWNDGSVWNGGQYWNGISANPLSDLVAMFLEWQSAHSQLAGVILASDPSSFDPTATPALVGDGTTTLPAATTLGVSWGHLVDPGTGLPTRLQSASWIYDRYYQ